MCIGLSNLANALQQAQSAAPVPYLDRLKEKQAKLIHEIHTKHRELATLTALIQFLTDRPEVADVAEQAMDV